VSAVGPAEPTEPVGPAEPTEPAEPGEESAAAPSAAALQAAALQAAALPASAQPGTGPIGAGGPGLGAPHVAVVGEAPAEVVVGTLTLPTGPIPLVAARLDLLGVPVAPAPGTAALLDEGSAQLVVLGVAIPLDDSVTVAVDGADPRVRTVVEAQALTPDQLAQHVRTLPEGEFQLAALSADGTWAVAELE
jgi:hypothetical protein